MKNLLTSTRRHDITFRRDGTINLSSRIVHLLGISPGDCINVALDNDEYLLYVQRRANECVGRHVGACRPAKQNGRYYRANSVTLCREMLRIAGEQEIVCYPAGAPVFIGSTIYLPIITRNSL